jgi:hypothetical protein
VLATNFFKPENTAGICHSKIITALFRQLWLVVVAVRVCFAIAPYIWYCVWWCTDAVAAIQAVDSVLIPSLVRNDEAGMSALLIISLL